MSEKRTDPRLGELLQRELARPGLAELDRIARDYDALIGERPWHVPTLLQRNRFRLAHARHIAQDRPRVLIGAMNDSHFPNFHTIPLLRVADVVSLTTGPDEGRPDRLAYDYWNERFVDVLRRLPSGFVPDLFLDNQVLGSHLIPIGLEEAPFPTVAGLTHVFRGLQSLHAAELFDVLLPLSRTFAEPLRRATGKHVLELPFGLNWGSFHHLLPAGPPHTERDVDLSCTIAPVRTLAGHSSARTHLVDFVRAFAERHGDRFRVVCAHGLPREEYLDLLRRSRVSVNLDNFHGPANYRTAEILNSGAACVHLHDPRGFAVATDIRELFEDGRELVVASWEDLEQKLLRSLEDAEGTQALALTGQARLEGEYDYESGYRRLFEEVARLDLGERERSARPGLGRAHFALGATYWHYQDDQCARRSILALPGVLGQPLETRVANLLALVPSLMRWHGDQAVLSLLVHEPAVQRAFGRGAWTGIQALHRSFADHPVVSWNRTMLAVELGHADAAMVRETLALVADDGPAFDPRDFLLVAPRPEYVEEPEEGQIRFGLFQHRVVAAWDEPERVLEVHRQYMRWHCLRWLHEHEEDRLEELLELWPDDSVLQTRHGERLRPGDPRAAERAFVRALALDPGAEDARRGLALVRLARAA